MLVKELIEKLQKKDPEALVVYSRSDCGYDAVTDCRSLLVRKLDNKSTWEGEFDDTVLGCQYTAAKDQIPAVAL